MERIEPVATNVEIDNCTSTCTIDISPPTKRVQEENHDIIEEIDSLMARYQLCRNDGSSKHEEEDGNDEFSFLCPIALSGRHHQQIGNTKLASTILITTDLLPSDDLTAFNSMLAQQQPSCFLSSTYVEPRPLLSDPWKAQEHAYGNNDAKHSKDGNDDKSSDTKIVDRRIERGQLELKSSSSNDDTKAVTIPDHIPYIDEIEESKKAEDKSKAEAKKTDNVDKLTSNDNKLLSDRKIVDRKYDNDDEKSNPLRRLADAKTHEISPRASTTSGAKMVPQAKSSGSYRF